MKTTTRAFLVLAALVAAVPATAQPRTHETWQNAPRGPVPAWQDGIVIHQSDTDVSRRTVWSDGRSATQFGATVIYNDGTLATRSGERAIFGNGRSCGQVGALTLCD